jgi:PAS domain S-box-containing protein
MQDKNKTKAQLISELELLRCQINDHNEVDLSSCSNDLSLQYCNALLNNITDFVYICDDQGKILYVNKAIETLSGDPAEDFINKTFEPFFDKENLKHAIDVYSRTLKGESPKYELTFKKTGIICAYSNRPLKDKNGKIIGILGTARDVTIEKKSKDALKRAQDELEVRIKERTNELSSEIEERKRTEEALNNAKITYESMFLNSMVGMSRTRLSDGKFMEINERLVEMFGYDDRADFLTNYSAVKCYAIPGERDRALAIMKEFGEVTNFETLAKRKDGSTFWIQYSGRVNKEGGYLDAVSLNIDEQVRAAEELKKSEEKYRMLIDTMNDGLGVIDKEGLIIFVNNTLCELLGYAQDEIIGAPVTRFLDEANREIILEQFSRRTKGIKEPYEIDFTRKDNSKVSTIVSPEPILDDGGNFIGSFAVITDITERIRLSERIEALNRCFLDFGTDPTENIKRLTTLLGTLMNGTCALYNRLDEGVLTSVGMWQAPPDFNPVDNPDGHICYDVIMSNSDDIFYVPNLSESIYAKTDINVINFNLKSYLGKAVTCNGVHVGSLCVAFQEEFIPTDEDRRCLEIVAVAVGIEEERKQAGEDLSSSREKLRHLSLHQQTMQEQERGRIARDIHDDLGQILTALDFDLAYMAKKLMPDQLELIEKTKKMSELIRSSTETVQRIASELRPALLDNLGLLAAMEWQAEKYHEHTGINCMVEFDSNIEISNKELSTALFRAFQEALTNAARHSNATNISAGVTRDNGFLVLQISDDGKGIKDEEISDIGSFGLSAMRERFYPFGGKVTIEGTKDKGTSISVTVPFTGDQ